MKKIAFALLAVSLAAPALADGNDQQQAATAKKKPHLICKRDEGATGTHMSPLVCRTADQWQALNEAGSGKLNAMSHSQVGGSGQSSLPSN